MSEPLSVLLIGCGDIAGGFDERGDQETVKSHAGAFTKDLRFSLDACVEPNAKRRAEFMAHWGINKGYEDVESCIASEGRFDVVSVCVPTGIHGRVLVDLLPTQPRFVFCEKPLTGEVEYSKRIVEAYEAQSVPLAVNYTRRWDPRISALRDELASGNWGELQGVTGLYAKGLLNCGSHFFDILHFLIGPLTPRVLLHRVDDGRIEDPTLSVFLETSTGAPVTLIGTKHQNFFLFEITLLMGVGQLSIENLGQRLRLRRVHSHPHFPDRLTLDEGKWEDTEMKNSLMHTLDNIYRHLTMNEPLMSNGRSALQVEEVYAQIMALKIGEEGL